MTTDLHVVELGAGEPVVFIHGSFGWGEETFPEQRALADGYRVLLVHRRGYGESPPAGDLGFEAQAEDVAEVLADGCTSSALRTEASCVSWPPRDGLRPFGR